MRNSIIAFAILSSLLIQACSTTNVVTSIVPGKELSRASLGEREVDNRVIMDEVEPLSVKLYRRIAKVEYTKSEYQAVKEIRHEKSTYNCSNAYDRYIAFMITTLAVPMLYEITTKFDILRGMCEKNPQTSIIETAATDQILTIESFDKEKAVTQEIPIAGESVVLEINNNKFVVSTSAEGIAAFPAKEIVSFYDNEKNSSFRYKYNDVSLALPFKRVEPQKEATPAKSSGPVTALSKDASADTTGDDAQETEVGTSLSQSKSDSMAMLSEQGAAKMAARKTDPQIAANTDPKLNSLSRKVNANAPGVEAEGAKSGDAAPKEKSDSMALMGEQSAALNSAQENSPQGKENQLPGRNKIARKLNKNKQNFMNEDENLKIVQKDKSIRIMNKSNMAMTIKRVSVHYNGRIIENLLSAPVVILPKSTSAELNRNNVIGEEFDDFESFGIAASYRIRSADKDKSLSKVNRYTEDKATEDPAESAKMNSTGSVMAAKSAAAEGSEALIAIGAEKTSDNAATDEWKIVLNIKFDTNKTTIRQEYYPRLKEIGETLKSNSGLRGVIEGHTDDVGSKELNKKISIRRAEVIAQHLTKNFGIAPYRLRVEGYGMSRPIADNATPKGRAMNRRIEAKFRDSIDLP